MLTLPPRIFDSYEKFRRPTYVATRDNRQSVVKTAPLRRTERTCRKIMEFHGHRGRPPLVRAP